MTENQIAEVSNALRESMTEYGVPEHDHDGLILYIVRGVQTGGFLEAVLSNDLRGAVERADTVNARCLCEIVRWLYNRAPAKCWGSHDAVTRWISSGGMSGQSGAGIILGQGDYQRDIGV